MPVFFVKGLNNFGRKSFCKHLIFAIQYRAERLEF